MQKVGGSEMAHLWSVLPFSYISLNVNILRSFFRQRKIDEEFNTTVSYFLKDY